VIVEDDVLIGGNCGVYEGTVVKRRVVLAAGVILTRRSTPIYDLVKETIHRAEGGGPLVIPEETVVVPVGSSPTPVIVKYRDASTDERAMLEAWLR
jgi:2,3,4,5-tetrahydropyridine-2-carboxylate N-succinyltransferase